MQPEAIRSYLLRFPRVTEETPFDAETVVYKTAGKIFALTNWDQNPLRLNLKCEPERAEELRDKHACVIPGYHMSKKHWNTVIYDGSVADEVFLEWIHHSFERVVMSMPKKLQAELFEEFKQIPTGDEHDHESRELRSSLQKGI